MYIYIYILNKYTYTSNVYQYIRMMHRCQTQNIPSPARARMLHIQRAIPETNPRPKTLQEYRAHKKQRPLRNLQ